MTGSPFVLSTLNQGLHDHMVKGQHEAIKSCRFKKKGTVMELMSGCGLNTDMLREHFSGVEVLERNTSMVESIKRRTRGPDVVHHADVRYFAWHERAMSYQCVFGRWCLCYLTKIECAELLCGIKRALVPGGCVILFESILGEGETEDRLHAEERQQLVVRHFDRYTQLFAQIGLTVLSATKHEKWQDEKNTGEDYACFIL